MSGSQWSGRHWATPPGYHSHFAVIMDSCINSKGYYRHSYMVENVRFPVERQAQGCSTWVPLTLRCDDGLLHVFPGDSRFSENIYHSYTYSLRTHYRLHEYCREPGELVSGAAII
jgi:hypothetical protein